MQRMSLKTTSFNNCIMKLMQHHLMIFYSIMATSMPKLKAAMKVVYYGETWVWRDERKWRKKVFSHKDIHKKI